MYFIRLFLLLSSTGVTLPGISTGITPYQYDEPIETPRYGMRSVIFAQPADQLDFDLLLPPQTALVIKCDPTGQTLADTLVPDYGLTESAWQAIDAAPRWLRASLTDNLMQLGSAEQNTLADMIINPPDPALRDEIVFQAAHISPNHLGRMDLQIILRNLDSLFAIDDELQYVEIVDYGDPSSDDDYYSTTRYVAYDTTDQEVTFEIPRDIYYWYIIHPHITDELPKIVYDKFWREFLYYDNGTVSYTENPDTPSEPYLLLRDELDTVTLAWGGEGDGAIGAVHRWVNGVMHWGATNPRPIQPNEIATDHDGNCGEYQDIKCAGARIALIPTVGVMDVNEDHVWCANWFPYDYASPDSGYWDPAQESAYDKDIGGSKYCSMIWNWRGDGYQYSDIETYSHSCTLTVTLYDTQGRPVSDADVKLQSEGWQSTVKVKGYAGITDRNGVFTTAVGEEQNYYITAFWENLGLAVDSASASAGSHFFFPCTLSSDYNPQPREMDDIDKSAHFSIEGELDTTISELPDEAFYLVFFNNYPEMSEQISGSAAIDGSGLNLQVDCECDIGHCMTYSYEEVSSQSAIQFSPGMLTDFFITDLQGVQKLGIEELPGLKEQSLALEISTIFSRGTTFKVSGCSDPIDVSIFDKLGRRVYTTSILPDNNGRAVVEWNASAQPAGVYFVRAKANHQIATGKIVMLD